MQSRVQLDLDREQTISVDFFAHTLIGKHRTGTFEIGQDADCPELEITGDLDDLEDLVTTMLDRIVAARRRSA